MEQDIKYLHYKQSKYPINKKKKKKNPTTTTEQKQKQQQQQQHYKSLAKAVIKNVLS